MTEFQPRCFRYDRQLFNATVLNSLYSMTWSAITLLKTVFPFEAGIRQCILHISLDDTKALKTVQKKTLSDALSFSAEEDCCIDV